MVRRSRCPPGVWCLTPGLAIVLVLLVVGIVYVLYTYNKDSNKKSDTTREKVNINTIEVVNQTSDDRYTRAPEPYRVWASTPDLRGALIPPGAVPINIPSRYYPEQFQQMGILKTADQQILPLFGRRTGGSAYRFNYYTRTDTYNPIQVPINYQRRDCMDDIGCDELMGGEDIKIRGLDKNAKVEVYKFDAPKYIAAIV